MLVFLKLGGSLITFKDKPHTPWKAVLAQAIAEIKTALHENPDLKIILGHGSGSFGHVPAQNYQTINGIHTQEQWKGFSQVWKSARDLNQIVMNELFNAGIDAICFPPSAQVTTSNRKIIHWDQSAINNALSNYILPVIYGDVIFDDRIHGTILSTEELFAFLAEKLHPDRILLAGIDEGVYSDFPVNKSIVKDISSSNFSEVRGIVGNSLSTDVTGGMQSKVTIMLDLIKRKRVKTVSIFNGSKKGNIHSALIGHFPGTTLSGLPEAK